MGARAASAGAPGTLSLDTLVRLKRERERRTASGTGGSVRLAVPEGMRTPLGCDAVSMPAVFGRILLPRLPRIGCVYADDTQWWWLVPRDSDVALEWPAPARYTAGAVVPSSAGLPGLIHKPDGMFPYTPPIPLYLALCRVTGTPPAWTRPVSA
ncbi:hypothetical protein [Streptomyces fructofermentans]|uniref:Uncharacterized protein n=1 Tax=Streptomyces fructofermentans TaxID=152141 RepID=A0A918KEQ3_9ACTN|nr:hypothetical protein [Streptomyces fructofermentans]GGX60646.1 hypothetical protein GCM10010515_30550 [Streptomyces fructofermentans]